MSEYFPKRFFYICLLACFTLIYSQPSHCFIKYNANQQNLPSMPIMELDIFRDITTKLTIDDISKVNFQSNFKPLIRPTSLFNNNDVFWLKLNLKNNTETEDWLLKNNFNLIEYIDLYVPNYDGNFLLFKSGLARKYKPLNIIGSNVFFPLIIKQYQEKTFYLKLRSNSPLLINWQLINKAQVTENLQQDNLYNGIFFGLMLLLLLSNIIFYALTKINNQLYLIAFIICSLLGYGLYDGTLTSYLPEAIFKHLFSIILSMCLLAAISLFIFYKQRNINQSEVLFSGLIQRILLVVSTLIICISLFSTISIPYQIFTIGLITVLSYCFIFSYHALKKQQDHARFLVIGCLVLILCITIKIYVVFNNVSDSPLLIREIDKVGIFLLSLMAYLSVISTIHKKFLTLKDTILGNKKNEKNFSQIFDQSHQMLFIVSANGVISSANNQVEHFLKLSKSEIIDKEFIDIFPSLRGVFDQNIIKQNIHLALEGQINIQTIVVYAYDGTLKDLEVTYQPFIESNESISNIIIQIRDTTKQNHAFKAIQDMVVGIAGLSTENFFRNFLIEISRIYKAKYVLFSEINELYPLTATSISIIKNRKIIQNITYSIKNSPSELLLKDHLCNFPNNVRQLFPEDTWLQENNIESYLGVNIKDANDNIIGFLSVMDDKPMHEDNYFIEVLDVFAARISNELKEQESQEALKQALEKLDFHITNTPLAVIEWDANFNVTKWNKAAEKIFGFTLAHFQNKNPLDILVPKEELEAVQRLSVELLENKGGQYSLNKNLTLDGRVILSEWYNTPLLNSNDEVIGVASLVNDVTAEHEALNALYIKENEQREIFNSLFDAVFIINHLGIITTVNNTTLKLFEYSYSELVGKNSSVLLPNETVIHTSSNINEHFNSSDGYNFSVIKELEGTKKSGSKFPMNLSIVKLANKRNNSFRLLITCHDLTEIKQHQETLRQSQKMDALGNLTGGIAHDFNNLLGIINGYSELLTVNIPPDSKQLRYATNIQKAAARGAKLTKKLLSFASKNTVETEQININDLLLDEFEMLQKTITPRINLTYILSDNLPLTFIDKDELEDCVLNLSINAMHAIPKHGEITVSTSVVDFNKQQAKVHNVKGGQYICLSVTDNGVGMDEITQQKAMEPFFTTKGKTGTGLGLSQVYGFADRAHGGIHIKSALEQGTTISLYLPVISQIPEINLNTPKIEHQVHSSANILIVDDEPALIDISKTILTQAGYSVFTANNATQALKYLESNQIDAILCDVIMPKMDGFELAKIIQEKYSDIAILFVSGYHESKKENIPPSFANNILAKPYHSDELLHRLSLLLEEVREKAPNYAKLSK